MDKKYKGLIWTNHVLERMQERGISQGDAWATWRNPDKSKYAKARGAWVYYKIIGRQQIEVVAKKNERGEWIILSVWSKPAIQRAMNLKQGENSFFKFIKSLVGL